MCSITCTHSRLCHSLKVYSITIFGGAAKKSLQSLYCHSLGKRLVTCKKAHLKTEGIEKAFRANSGYKLDAGIAGFFLDRDSWTMCAACIPLAH
ncbi:hypothetical protein NPIL_317091 [Nephila pilipes]|uniref:Uncharacterized protein n=1 Tax=Nephila pilipes TaxID=299642 RepID=A0A8X6MEX4_NEPPI|nr:hypothetical protein NPIL_317091 [Nephila pilipes]